MPQIGIIHKLRGVAALMVFAFHLIYLSEEFFNFYGIRSVFFYGRFGIHVFFVISGFVIVHSLVRGNYQIGKWKTFIIKRLIRLEPPYLVVLLLTFSYLMLRAWLKGPDKDTPDFSQLLLHVGYLIPFTDKNWLSIVFWSLAVEFQFYFLISIGYPLLIKNVFTRWAIYISFWALQFAIPSMEFFQWSLVFVPGMQLALYKNKLIQRTEFVFSFFVLPILIYFNYYFEVFAFSFATFLLIYFQRDFKSAILDFFGDISYSLYLVHMLVYVPAFNIALVNFNFPLGRAGMFIGITSAVIFTSYLLYRFVEKPSKQYAGRVKYTDRHVLKEARVEQHGLVSQDD